MKFGSSHLGVRGGQRWVMLYLVELHGWDELYGVWGGLYDKS